MIEFFEEKDSFFGLNPYYSGLYRTCNFIGAWPYGRGKGKVIRFYLTFFLLIFLLLGQIPSYLTMQCNFRGFAEGFLILGPSAAVTTLFYSVNYKQIVQHKIMLDHLKYDWCNFQSMEELTMLNKYAMEGKIYLLIFAPLCYLPFVSFLLLSMITISLDHVMKKNGTYQSFIPLRIEFFLIINKEECLFSLIFLILLLLVLLATVCVANLGMLLMAIQHACCMFRLVGMTLNNLFEEKRLSFNKMDEDEISATIFRAILQHNRVIEFVEMLSSLVSLSYLIHIIIGVIILIIDITMLLQFDFDNGKIEELFATIIHTLCMLSVGSSQCFIGQKLSDHSTTVFQETITLPWYVLSPKLQKLSLLIMMRSMKQCSLTISKIFTPSYELFNKGTQYAMSYAMVFRSL